MKPNAKAISELKSQLRVAISNLKNLENVNSGAADSVQENDIKQLMLETNTLFSKLESANAKKICKMIEKRKRKRRNAKMRHKLIKQSKLKEIVTNTPISTSNPLKDTSDQSHRTIVSTITANQKPHQQLRIYRDSNRFLRTFELLERLHKTRVQDEELTREFSENMCKLRSIWNVIRMENIPENTNDIKNQWDTVFFGVPEKSYYKKEKNFNDLICVRRKWDSYITQEANIGSSVPLGWVLPSENADPRWSCYRIQ